MTRLLVTVVMICLPTSVRADCIDIDGIEFELKPGLTTPGKVQISFKYNLAENEYSLSWKKDGYSAGPFGPFPLTMSCGTPGLKWENDDFLVLERGCGTFCWYAKVFYLKAPAPHPVPLYQRIWRPLAFDAGRNLIAYYHAKDRIRIKNLITGHEQTVRTAHECESYSGLCFKDTGFSGDGLEYTWIWNPTDEKVLHPLEQALLE